MIVHTRNQSLNQQLSPVPTELLLGTAIPGERWRLAFFPNRLAEARLGSGAIATDGTGTPIVKRFEYYSAKPGIIPRYDTATAPGSPVAESRIAPNVYSSEFVTHRMATRVTKEDLASYGGRMPAFVATSQNLPQNIVSLDLQYRAAQAVMTSGNFTGSAVTISSGAEWDASGDLLGDVQTATVAVATKNGLTPSQLMGVMTWYAYMAAQKDPDFKEYALAGVNSAGPSVTWNTAPRLAEYLGLGGVMVIGPRQEIASILADTTWILPIPSQSQSPDPIMEQSEALLSETDPAYLDPTGANLWGFGFSPSVGQFLEPWYDNKTNEWVYPFERHHRDVIANTDAAAIIKNCSSRSSF